jgi:protein TonB
MERHFGLPIAFAAAAHAALLFGFSKAPRVVTPVEDGFTCVFPLSPPPEIEPEPEVATSKDSVSLERPDISPPRQPEPPAIDVPAFTQPKPPPTDFDPSTITRVIPTDLSGTRGDISGRIGTVVSPDLLDNPPRTRFQAPPAYPFEAKRTGLMGDVMVEFTVDESGRVHDPHVVNSSDRVFEESALRAVAKWIFEPGKRAGRTVRFRMSVPIVFRLNE